MLKPQSHIHLLGICGTAMASLAGLLKSKGFYVTGSDSNPYPPMSTQLEKLGIEILKPYSKKNIYHYGKKPDFCVIGNVISQSNEEAQEVIKEEIPFSSLPEIIGDYIIDQRESIVVAGTHGKTTTTSLLSWVAENENLKPGFLIGGIPKNFSTSFQLPGSNYFIIEGDEYDTAYFDKVPKFIHYKPKHVILTSIEFDHADIYRDLDHVKDAFKMLLERIPKEGSLFYSGEDQNINSILSHTGCQNIFSYGTTDDCDYQAKNISYSENFSDFDVFFKNKFITKLKTKMPGEYNVKNALAVFAMSLQLKWSQERVQNSLQSFDGVKRRQEILGEPRGILVIEDFAHHPTAVKETIKGIKNKYPTRKLFSVFEPRSATSRRKVFQKDYAQAFEKSEHVFLAQAFDQDKINPEDRFSSEELVDDINRLSEVKKAKSYSKVDEIVEDLYTLAKSGDLVLIMSNGGFDGIYQKLLRRLA